MKHALTAVAMFALGGSGLLPVASVSGAFAQQVEDRSQPRPAQQGPTTVRIDTVPRQSKGRRAAPSGVKAVRRRIRQIGGGGQAVVQRVIYPVIVIPQAAAVAEPQQQSGPVARPGGAPLSLRGRAQGQVPYYYPGGNAGGLSNRRGLYYDPSTGQVRIRRQNGDDLVPLPDSASLPDSVSRPIPVRPLQGAAPPTVRRVERAILETGLFRASNVNFEFDESTLLPVSRNTLNAVGEVLARYPALRIAVEGHTDAIGSAEYNQALSERRAEAVVRYLNEHFGLDAERLKPVGLGESQFVASNETATGRTLNRRVSFRVLNPEAAEQYLETEEPAGGEGGGASSERDSSSSSSSSSLRDAIRRGVREGMRPDSSAGQNRPGGRRD